MDSNLSFWALVKPAFHAWVYVTEVRYYPSMISCLVNLRQEVITTQFVSNFTSIDV